MPKVGNNLTKVLELSLPGCSPLSCLINNLKCKILYLYISICATNRTRCPLFCPDLCLGTALPPTTSGSSPLAAAALRNASQRHEEWAIQCHRKQRPATFRSARAPSVPPITLASTACRNRPAMALPHPRRPAVACASHSSTTNRNLTGPKMHLSNSS